MQSKIRWGILSTAKIAREKVIPAMQKGKFCEIAAIASRNATSAHAEAKRLGISTAYGSYEELLADKTIQAIYIPLPNHMHVEWAIKCLEAGKHVLCEKPIAMNPAEAEKLADYARSKPGLKLMEAFMYRFHPQWQHAKKLVREKQIGELRTIQSFFSYYNTDPNNIRNKPEAGGGAMMDIGCYCVSLSRFIYEKEPQRVLGKVEYDPLLGTDIISSGMLDFGNGTGSFTCSTQLAPYQRVNILGTEGRIEIEIPFNAPSDRATRLWLHKKNSSEEITFDITDQYTIQGDLFSQAILNNQPVPTPIEDALNNTRAIHAVLQSDKEKKWMELRDIFIQPLSGK
jgi:predicted dehydrogenase